MARWAASKHRTFALAAAIAALAMPVSAAQLVSRHTDWSIYQAESAGERLCFLVSEPKEKLPAGARRDPPHFYVSAWPKAGVRAEVSVKLGYSVKKGTDATIRIEDQIFRLFAEADRVYVGDPTQELKLIEAMRTGRRMVVEATSERGTLTTDRYSLSGITQGLQALVSGCQ